MPRKARDERLRGGPTVRIVRSERLVIAVEKSLCAAMANEELKGEVAESVDDQNRKQ
jgi:hypothetical protein